MKEDENEEQLLREVTLQNAQRIFRARQRAEEELVSTKEALWKQSEWLRVTLASIGDAVVTTDTEGRVLSLNAVAESLTGWTQPDAQGRPLTEIFRIINEETRQPVENPALRALQEGRIVGLANHTILIARDGTETPIDDSAAPIRDEQGQLYGVVLIFRSIAERKQAEEAAQQRAAFLQLQTQTLQLLVEGAPLTDVLGTLVRAMQNQSKQKLRAAIHLLDEQGTRFLDAIAPDLPESYARATEGMDIHSKVGPCCWAALSGATVTVADIAADPRWSAFAEFAEPLGIRSAMSLPIFSADHKTLGTFANYYPQPGTPDPQDLQIAEVLRRTVALAIERRRAEEDLRASEMRFRTLSEAVPTMVWVCRPDGFLLYLNQRWIEYTGQRPEEYQGYGWAETLHPEDRPRVLAHWEHCTRTGALYEGECRYRRHDGVYHWHYFRGVPLRGEDGEITAWYGTSLDIEDKKLTEQALQESEQQLRLALEAGRMGTWEWDVVNSQVIWSSSLEALHGLAPGTFGGTFDAFQADMHPEDRERVLHAIAETLERDKDYQVEYRIMLPGGGLRWIEGRGRLFRDKAGLPARMLGVCSDITERKLAEQTTHFLANASAALSELTDYESTLQKVAALAVPFFADWCAVDMRETDGSVRRLAVTHTDPTKVQLAHELFRRYPPYDDDPHGVMQVLRTGATDWVASIPDSLLVELAQDEEHLRIMRELGLKSYICVPLKSRTGTYGVLTFVTAESGRVYSANDLHAAEDLAHRAVIAIENANLLAALKESDRRKDEFLAILAHELRNPLAPVRNAVQILRAKGPLVPELQWAREVIDRQVDQMTRLVDDLLDVSRITRGKIELRKQQVELRAVVNDAVETSRPLIEQYGHTLSVELPAEPILLVADATRLAQVLLNLLNNAAKYTERGGRIWLTAEPAGKQVVIRVKDTGIGIPADMLPHIFEMFAQVDRSIERTQGGLGIGLTLVQRLVALHGGTVEARSQGLGEGSEFIVRLPIVLDNDLSVQAGAVEDERSVAATPLRVLVVDDNQDSADSMAMFLRITGHEVRTVHDGLAAVEEANNFQPNVILLDIGLPKLNGYDAARHIREEHGDAVLLIALTGWGQEEDRRRSREAGFDHHLTKPIDFDDLDKLLADANPQAPQPRSLKSR